MNFSPFGLEHKGYNNVVNGVENNHFTYVGKERNESLGYNMLEMDWRHYDPAIGRFVSIDVYAESYESLTPYHYGENSPIMYSDPTGLFADYYNESGEYLGTDGIDDKKVYQTTNTAWEDNVDGEVATKFGGADFDALNSDGGTHYLGTKNEFGLIQLTGMGNDNIANYGSEDKYSYTDKKGNKVASGNHGDDWVTPEVGAAFNAAVNEFVYANGGATVKVNDASAFNPAKNLGHSTHFEGKSIDLPFMKTNGTHSNNISNLSTADKNFNGKFVNILKGKKFTKNYSDKGSIPNTKHSKGHKNHLHVGKK